MSPAKCKDPKRRFRLVLTTVEGRTVDLKAHDKANFSIWCNLPLGKAEHIPKADSQKASPKSGKSENKTMETLLVQVEQERATIASETQGEQGGTSARTSLSQPQAAGDAGARSSDHPPPSKIPRPGGAASRRRSGSSNHTQNALERAQGPTKAALSNRLSASLARSSVGSDCSAVLANDLPAATNAGEVVATDLDVLDLDKVPFDLDNSSEGLPEEPPQTGVPSLDETPNRMRASPRKKTDSKIPTPSKSYSGPKKAASTLYSSDTKIPAFSTASKTPSRNVKPGTGAKATVQPEAKPLKETPGNPKARNHPTPSKIPTPNGHIKKNLTKSETPSKIPTSSHAASGTPAPKLRAPMTIPAKKVVATVVDKASSIPKPKATPDSQSKPKPKPKLKPKKKKKTAKKGKKRNTKPQKCPNGSERKVARAGTACATKTKQVAKETVADGECLLSASLNLDCSYNTCSDIGSGSESSLIAVDADDLNILDILGPDS